MGGCCDKEAQKEGRLLDHDAEQDRAYNAPGVSTITIPPRDGSRTDAATPQRHDGRTGRQSSPGQDRSGGPGSAAPIGATPSGAAASSSGGLSRGASAAAGTATTATAIGAGSAAALADAPGSAAVLGDIPGAPSSSLLMRHVVVDPKKLQAIVDHAEESYLDVDRSLLNVSRDDPDDPGNQELVARLRAVEVAPSAEATRVLAAALPRSSLSSPEAVASALSAPAGGASAMAEATRRVAAAADSVALRDTGLPVVAGFSRR